LCSRWCESGGIQDRFDSIIPLGIGFEFMKR
jgi:CDP-diglyceride synthetase